MNDKVDILLATFNGEKYLESQIDSILKQTYTNWQLIIHDDGSNDNTTSIIKNYKIKYPEKIKFIDDNIKTGGPKQNFFYLLNFIESDYIMFCDQDDFWMKDKISSSLQLIKEKENEKENENIPILIHTDLAIADKNLNIIYKSMSGYKKFKSPQCLLDTIFSNSVTGCTILCNRKLINQLSTPKEAVIHDWWLAIETYRNNGKIYYLNQPTILYRQHEKNNVGAIESISPYIFLRKINALFSNYKQFRIVSKKSFLYFILKTIKYRWR